MMGAILGIISWIVSKLFGKPPGPSQEAQQAAKAATATQALSTEGQAVAELQTAAAARATADAQRVRDDPNGDAVISDPSAPINTDPNGHFRD